MFLRKRLANAVLDSIEKLTDERVLRFAFSAKDEIGQAENYTLVAQLTGRSANLFLLDKNDFILDSCRETFGAGQEIASRYAPPRSIGEVKRKPDGECFPLGEFKSLSESLDAHFIDAGNRKDFPSQSECGAKQTETGNFKARKIVREIKSGFRKTRRRGKLETIRRFIARQSCYGKTRGK